MICAPRKGRVISAPAFHVGEMRSYRIATAVASGDILFLLLQKKYAKRRAGDAKYCALRARVFGRCAA